LSQPIRTLKSPLFSQSDHEFGELFLARNEFLTAGIIRSDQCGMVQELEDVVGRYEFPKLNQKTKYKIHVNPHCSKPKIHKPKLQISVGPRFYRIVTDPETPPHRISDDLLMIEY